MATADPAPRSWHRLSSTKLIPDPRLARLQLPANALGTSQLESIGPGTPEQASSAAMHRTFTAPGGCTFVTSWDTQEQQLPQPRRPAPPPPDALAVPAGPSSPAHAHRQFMSLVPLPVHSSASQQGAAAPLHESNAVSWRLHTSVCHTRSGSAPLAPSSGSPAGTAAGLPGASRLMPRRPPPPPPPAAQKVVPDLISLA